MDHFRTAVVGSPAESATSGALIVADAEVVVEVAAAAAAVAIASAAAAILPVAAPVAAVMWSATSPVVVAVTS